MSVTKERDGEKEKERGSQLRRHVANCRAACSEGNRSRRWRRLREGRSGEMTSGRDETEERTAVRKVRCDAKRDGRQRRPVICDSKRTIHLATCQDSIGGICLWNQSRRTLPVAPRLLHVPFYVRFCDCFRAGLTKPAGPNGKRQIYLMVSDCVRSDADTCD